MKKKKCVRVCVRARVCVCVRVCAVVVVGCVCVCVTWVYLSSLSGRQNNKLLVVQLTAENNNNYCFAGTRRWHFGAQSRCSHPGPLRECYPICACAWD